MRVRYRTVRIPIPVYGDTPVPAQKSQNVLAKAGLEVDKRNPPVTEHRASNFGKPLCGICFKSTTKKYNKIKKTNNIF